MSPDQVTAHAQARPAGSHLGDGKTHVALQSPAVVQHPLRRTAITGFLENQLAVLPFAGHGAAGGSAAQGVGMPAARWRQTPAPATLDQLKPIMPSE